MGGTNTERFSTLMVPLGVRGARRSERAIKMPRVKTTVVKKEKVFWRRVRELCMVGEAGGDLMGEVEVGEPLLRWIRRGRNCKLKWKLKRKRGGK